MFGNEDSTITGVFSARDPPDLIPNSEVKTRSGDGTWLAGAWESIAMPVSTKDSICSDPFSFVFF